MSSYELIKDQAVTQPITSLPNPRPRPWGAQNPESPPAPQVFHLVVLGQGAVSGTAQVYVSNDALNWIAYGDPIVAAGANGVGQAAFTGTAPWKYYGAFLTAISGAQAKATLRLDC